MIKALGEDKTKHELECFWGSRWIVIDACSFQATVYSWNRSNYFLFLCSRLKLLREDIFGIPCITCLPIPSRGLGRVPCMTVSQRLNQMGEEQFPRKKNNVVNIRRYGNGCWLNNNKMYPAQCFLIRVASLALAGSPTFWFLLRSLTSIVTAFTWKSLQWTRHLGHSNTTSFLYSCSPRDCKQVSTISNL